MTHHSTNLQDLYRAGLAKLAKVENERARAIWGRSGFEVHKMTDAVRATISRKAKARRAKEALSTRQAVIVALSRDPGCTTVQLAEAVQISKAGLQPILAKLLDDGMVRRFGHANKFRWELSA